MPVAPPPIAGRRVRSVSILAALVATLAACSGGTGTPAELAELADDADGADEVIEVGEPEPEPQLSVEELAAYEPPPVRTPDEVLPEVSEERSDQIAEAAQDGATEILAAAPIDLAPTDEEIAAFGDGRPRTATGRLIALDEAASLACANVEMTIWALDDGDRDEAADRLSQATEWAEESEAAGMGDWAVTLGQEATDPSTADPVVLVGFLEACVAGGYEI